MKKKFKPFDKVVVREAKQWPWRATFYSHYNPITYHHYTTSGAPINEILPYEGNEHLVGTSVSPDEEVRLEEGEWIMCAAATYDDASDWHLRQFSLSRETAFLVVNGGYWNFAIRFSDFNPNDMEETSRHILCVKNGKIIRYKG